MYTYQGGCKCTHIRVGVYVRISGLVYMYTYQGGCICKHIRVGVFVHISGCVYVHISGWV